MNQAENQREVRPTSAAWPSDYGTKWPINQ